jgi:hypothetical protein
MPSKYIRMIGFCLLGGGAPLVFGSMKELYRRGEQAARYRELLAPHLATVPEGGAFSVGTDSEKKFAMQIPADETFELKFLQMSSEHGADAGTTIALAVGGLILMGVGMRLSSNSACTPCRKEEAQNKSCEATGDNVSS